MGIKYQYSLIDKEVAKKIHTLDSYEELGICIKKFKANFEIENLSNYKVGDEIILGNEKCIISKCGKDCYPNDCGLFKKLGKSCILKDAVAFV